MTDPAITPFLGNTAMGVDLRCHSAAVAGTDQTIAPRRVEQKFDGVPGIRRVFLVGDGRDSNVLLIVPDRSDHLLNAPDDGVTGAELHAIPVTLAGASLNTIRGEPCVGSNGPPLIYAAATLCEWFSMIFRTRSPLTRDFITIGRVSYFGDTTRTRAELIPTLQYRSLEEGIGTL